MNSFPLAAYGMHTSIASSVEGSQFLIAGAEADRIEIGSEIHVEDGSCRVVRINRIFDRAASRLASGAGSALLHRVSAGRSCEKPHGRGRSFAVE